MTAPSSDPNPERSSVAVSDVIAAFLKAVDEGREVDREGLLARHPHLADELRKFFATHDRVDRLARPLRQPGPAGYGDSSSARESTTGYDTPAAIATEAGAGAAFGDYELLGEIARGGMGVVCKARQKSADRLVD